MKVSTILYEIKRLSILERMLIIENIMRSIREEASSTFSLEKSAQAMLSEYQNNEELTAFTALDGDGFYEYEAE